MKDHHGNTEARRGSQPPPPDRRAGLHHHLAESRMHAVVLSSVLPALGHPCNAAVVLNVPQNLGQQTNLSVLDIRSLVAHPPGNDRSRVDSLLNQVHRGPQRIPGQLCIRTRAHPPVGRQEAPMRVQNVETGNLDQGSANNGRVHEKAPLPSSIGDQLCAFLAVDTPDVVDAMITRPTVFAAMLAASPANPSEPIPRRHRMVCIRPAGSNALRQNRPRGLQLAHNGVNSHTAFFDLGDPLLCDRCNG